MSEAEASRFIEATINDPELSKDLSALAKDSEKVFAEVRARGFDATPEEIREAFMEKSSTKISEEELAAIAAGEIFGTSDKRFYTITGATGGALIGAGLLVIAGAAAAL